MDGIPWVDEDEQEVRPYALTGGRTRPTNEMSLSSLLKARAAAPGGYLSPEQAQALALCRGEPRSVAEVAATLRQPMQVTKILLSRPARRRRPDHGYANRTRRPQRPEPPGGST